MSDPIRNIHDIMRRVERLPRDEIAVSALFPPDRVIALHDHDGTVFAVGMKVWQDIKRDFAKNGGTTLLGVPVILADSHDETARRVRERIARCMKAGFEVSDLLARLAQQGGAR